MRTSMIALMAGLALLFASCQIKVVERSKGSHKEEKVQVQAGPMKLDISTSNVPFLSRAGKDRKDTILVVKLSGVVRPTNREGLGMTRSSSLEYWLRLIRKGQDYGGVLVRVNKFVLPLEYSWELFNEINRLRKNGVKVWVHGEEFTGSTYYLALAGEKVSMEPLGDWGVRGVGVAGMFFKGLLDKLGMKFDGVQIGEYKGAMENLTRDSYSPEFRQTLTTLVDSMYDEYVNEVASARSLDASAVKEAMDQGIMDARDAASRKLVDSVEPFGAVLERFKKETGLDSVEYAPADPSRKHRSPGFFELLSQMKPKAPPSSPHIALVYASGPIVTGSSQDSGDMFGNEAIYSANLVKTLNKLYDMPQVKGVVLRVDSPGGSALASKEIWHALGRLRDSGRVVVVSMGRVAASGGYFISAPATKIFVSPYTITGSIGVVGGKFVVNGTMSYLGITTETIHRGKSWDMFLGHREFTKEERARMESYMKRVYADFVNSITKYRKPYIKDMDGVARGRIWSGRDAVKNGLADVIGGLADAIAEARKLAGLSDDARVVEYPRPKAFMEVLSEALSKMGPRDLHELPSLMVPVELRAMMKGDAIQAMGPIFEW